MYSIHYPVSAFVDLLESMIIVCTLIIVNTRIVFDLRLRSCPIFLCRVEARCAFGKFSCAGRDPCSPALCESGVMKYPGLGPRTYVDCDVQGRCSDRRCPVRQQWDQDRQRCRRR